jgi:hypothetical protein
VTRTLAGTTFVMLAGATVTGAIYWGLLNTPESTVWMLALSVILAAVAAAVAALTIGVVLLAWSGQAWSRALAVRAARGLPACVPPVLLVALVWWLVLHGTAWVDAHSGEISAWFIARFGWSDVHWLFTTAAWIAWWLQWVVAPFVALVWWRSILVAGWRPTGALLPEALRPARVLVATALVLVLVWMPWTQLVPWRPRALAPGTMELVFVAAKLGVVALLSAIGWSLVARTAATAPPATESRL